MNKKSNYKIDIVSNTTKLNLIKKNNKQNHYNTFKTISKNNYCPFYIANTKNNYNSYSFEDIKNIKTKKRPIHKKELTKLSFNSVSLNKCVNI